MLKEHPKLAWVLVQGLDSARDCNQRLLAASQRIEESDEAFQALHPYLPLTRVVIAFRASLFHSQASHKAGGTSCT